MHFFYQDDNVRLVILDVIPDVLGSGVQLINAGGNVLNIMGKRIVLHNFDQ